MKILKRCLGMLYPQTCCFCGKVSAKKICDKCKKNIEYIEEPRCKKCGKPLEREEAEFCYDCENSEFSYEQGKSIWLHKGAVKWSVYQFKYHNRRIYGQTFAEELFRLYGKKIKEWKIDVIIPVPLHPRRKRKRGYNQAEILAKHLGKQSGLPVETRAVIRCRHTKAQKELNHKERHKNLKDAFAVTKHWKGQKNILLIDDIYTTGNTIDSVACVLKENGAQNVWFLTISIGQGF